MSLTRKHGIQGQSKEPADGTGPLPEPPVSSPRLPEPGAPRDPESYLAGEQLLDYYRGHVDQLSAMVMETRQSMEVQHQQLLTQVHFQYQQLIDQASGMLSERRGLHQQWLNASSELLAKLVEVADAAELASCLEGAPLGLAARFLAIEPGLAQVVPCAQAPLDELTLLWRGLAG